MKEENEMLKMIWKSKIRAVWDRLWGWLALVLLSSGTVLGVIWLLHAGVEAIMPGFIRCLEWCGGHALLVLAVLLSLCLICVYIEGRAEAKGSGVVHVDPSDIWNDEDDLIPVVEGEVYE